MAALRMRVELARNHILDHALTQRADGAIVGHGEFHSLSEVAKTSILKKGSPPLNHSSRNWLPRSQFSARLSGLSRSDLVPWHDASMPATARVGPEVGVELPMVRAGH
jgi:hypothetical protein